MQSRAIVAIAASACGSSPPPQQLTSRATVTRPEVELVVAGADPAGGDTPVTLVRFARTAPTGLVVTRTVRVPGSVTSLAWNGPEPVVMLDSGEVGHISGTGYERFPMVPNTMWTIPKPTGSSPDSPTGRFDTPRWRMVVSSAGDVWQARCDWGWDLPHGIAHHCVPEGGRCDAWVYARVWPGPTTISRDEPPLAFDSAAAPSHVPIPKVTPAAEIRAEIVQVAADDVQRSVLRCTAHGETIQYPTDDDRDLRDSSGDGVSDLTWLSTTPPMFAVTRRVGCLDTESVIFEGCKQSEAYAGALVGGGPHDVLTLWHQGGKLSLRWHDQELGSVDDVSLVAFAPAR